MAAPAIVVLFAYDSMDLCIRPAHVGLWVGNSVRKYLKKGYRNSVLCTRLVGSWFGPFLNALDGQVYHHNAKSGESTWEHPLDAVYRQRLEAEKQALASRMAATNVVRDNLLSLLPRALHSGTSRTFGKRCILHIVPCGVYLRIP